MIINQHICRVILKRSTEFVCLHLFAALALVPCATGQSGSPAAFSQPPGPVQRTNATLNGMAFSGGYPTLAWFEWGLDANYGNTTEPVSVPGSPAISPRVLRISSPIASLAEGAVYHYRLVSSNEVGIARGYDQRFTTGMRIQNWGAYPYGRPAIPAGLTNLVSVAAGHGHCLAIRNDGTVVAWIVGFIYPDHGQTNVPAGLSNVVAVAGGYTHSLALKNDGTVAAWGAYMDGKAATVPPGLTNVIAIAGGDSHSVALRDDGTVVAWGENSSGQTNVPYALRNVVAISCGSAHTLALKVNGTVVVWGSDLGSTAPPSSATNVVAIATEGWYNLALRRDSTVVDWGTYNSTDIPKPTPLTNLVALGTGYGYGEVLKSDGTLVAWGKSTDATNIPPGLSNVVAFASGDDHCLGLAPVNLPPQCFAFSRTGGTNQDMTLTLPVFDPNGDALETRITTLPTRGTLFQYTDNGRGDPITAAGTVLLNPPRVIFAPDPGTYSWGYATLGFSVNDGEFESAPATGFLSIVPPPVIQSVERLNTPAVGLSLGFSGLSGGEYFILRSVTFGTWYNLGRAAEIAPGQFSFTDYTITNSPAGFYRIWAY